jgi:hypothetical protein
MSSGYVHHEPEVFDRVQKIAGALGAIGLVASIAGWVLVPEQFFRSWLVAFIFIASISIGSLILLMIQYLTGGMWGLLLRRQLESAVKLLPLIAIFFIPVAIGMHSLYEWTHEDVVAADHLLQKKAPYLNTPFFLGRAVVFLLLWVALGVYLNKLSRDYEETQSPWTSLRLRHVSAIGLLIMATTLTFASVDWMMSLEPHWFSTMYGISFIVGTLLSAMAVMISVLVRTSRIAPVSGVVTPMHFRDFGNLLLAFTMLWAYTGFSQFMLIWYANIREEAPWYLARIQHGWGIVAVILIVFHFFLPFFVLLLRAVKDQARLLGIVALLVLAMRFVDYFWLIQPAFRHGGESHFALHWTQIASLLGVAGVWLALFLRGLKRRSLLPMQEIAMQEGGHD